MLVQEILHQQMQTTRPTLPPLKGSKYRISLGRMHYPLEWLIERVIHPPEIRTGHPIQDWPTLSSEAMDSTLRIALTASASVGADSLINITVEGYPQLSILHDLNIIALVKESDIVSPQLLSDDTRDADYIHNNVLRAFITDPWGESFGISPMVTSDTLTSSLNMTWNSTWVQENSAVVVYVCHPDNYRILQVIEVPID